MDNNALDLKKSNVMSELSLTLSQMGSNAIDNDFKATLKEKSKLSIQERRAILQEKKYKAEVKHKFTRVLSDLIKYDSKYYTEEDLAAIEQISDKGWKLLREAFIAQAQSESVYPVQSCALPDNLYDEEEVFEVQDLFPQENESQEQVLNNLMSSLILAEKSQIMAQEESSDSKEVTAPVTVGWMSWLGDKIWGASNLVSELENKQVSLDTLKKSPDMQKRINDMIASYSPSNKRNPNMLKPLMDIYEQLNKLNVKFVDSKVNSEIYNACSKWLAEEEIYYAAHRKARILAIASLLRAELQKMVKEEEPTNNIIMNLEKLKELTSNTGMVEVSDENMVTHVTEPEIFNIVCHLEALSEELLKEENSK
jgi:hypothetical protein